MTISNQEATDLFFKAVSSLMNGDQIKAAELAFKAISGLVGREVIKGWLTESDMKEVNKLVDQEEKEKLST